MSGSLTPTVPASPSTVATAAQMIATMAGQTSIPTDYNKGSAVRTLLESVGSVVEMQALSDQATAFQSLVYGAMSLFGVSKASALTATGIATFATSFPLASAAVVSQAVFIPSGTLMQTQGGVQFSTIVNTTLASGTSSIAVGVQAALPGVGGNVNASGITGSPLTAIGYPLSVTNAVATAGGANAGSQSTALSLFTAKAASLGLASPVAVANGPIGVIATGTGEVVAYAACYEPWLAAGSGAGSGTAGFTVYIDNGTGTASASLIAAVTAWITGSVPNGQSGFRPAGVPFVVSAVTAVFATVSATGVLLPGLFGSSNVATVAASGVQAYFATLGISAPTAVNPNINAAQQPQIAGAIADAGAGAYSSLQVNLAYSAASGVSVTAVSGGVGTRIILSSLNLNITGG